MKGPALVTSALLVLVVALILAQSGCNQAIQRVAVSGQVHLDGKPLTVGTIRFIPASGRPASSHILADGSFRIIRKSLSASDAEVAGLYPGNYRIAVTATESLGDSEQDEVRWLIPRRYGDFRTSGLEADIQEPTESMIIELAWKDPSEQDAETSMEKTSVLEKDRETLKEQGN